MLIQASDVLRRFLSTVNGIHSFGRWTVAVTTLVSPLAGFLILRTRKQIQSWVAYALDAFVVYPVGRWVKHSVSSRATLRRYCLLQQSDEQVQYLYVPARQELKLKVVDIFVPLQLESQEVNPIVYTHADLLSLGNRIRVIGDPGSGKSSLIKRLYLDCCWSGIHRPAQSRLPCLINLNSLSIPTNIAQAKIGNWLYEYIRQIAAQTAVFKMKDCFDTYAQGPGILVLLDGLDEVSRTQYQRIQTGIDQLGSRLAKLSEKNTVVLTMRTQFYQEIRHRMRDTTGQAVYVKPFSPTDIYEFLRKWPFNKDASQLRNRIYGDLSDRPTLREMCTNPLVLSMFVGEYHTTSASITPESRTEFYSRVTDELLIRRRLTQTERPPAPSKLREQREQILGRLAFNHLLDSSQPSNSLQVKSIKEIICEITKCDQTKVEAIYRDLAKETGLISEERPGETIRFIHLTFCEFLAAREAIQERERGFEALCSAHKGFQQGSNPQIKSRLLEVLPFASGLLVRKERPQALQSINRFNDYRLSARCFLETKAYEHSSWLVFVKRATQEFMDRPADQLDDAWLRDLHLFNVVIRDAEQALGYSHTSELGIDLDTFYDAVLRSREDRIEVLLKAYARQDAAAAFRLADSLDVDLLDQFPDIIVSNCDQRPFLEMVIERTATADQSQRELWAMLVAESAIRYKIVAEMLMAHELDTRLSNVRPLDLSRSQRTLVNSMGKTFYSQLIGVAMSSDRMPQGVTLIKAAKLIRLGFGSWSSWPMAQLALLWSMLALTFAGAYVSYLADAHRLGFKKEFAGIMLVYLALYFMARGLVLRNAIKAFFNVRRGDSGGGLRFPSRFLTKTPFILGEHERFLVWIRYALDEGLSLGKEFSFEIRRKDVELSLEFRDEVSVTVERYKGV